MGEVVEDHPRVVCGEVGWRVMTRDYSTDHLREFLSNLTNGQVLDYAERLGVPRGSRPCRAAYENAICLRERMRVQLGVVMDAEH